MGQITEGFAQTMLKHCEQGQHPPLTVWETEQLVRAWLDRERLRKLLQQVLTDAQAQDVLLEWWHALECETVPNGPSLPARAGGEASE